MSVDQASRARPARANTATDVLLDGLFLGMIGAILVAVWYLILDVAAGRPFYTPALLGTVLMHGGLVAANGPVIAPLEVIAYTAVHFLAFLGVGLLLSWLMTLFDKFPIVGFVILVVFVCLQIGFFVLNLALGAELLGRLRVWTVLVANLLAAGGMGLYAWKRHPGVMAGVERMWEES